MSFRGHMASVEPETSNAPRIETPKASRYPPPQPTTVSRERRKLSQPQRGPWQGPGKKRFHCFLSVPERLSLQRFLKINVVHSKPLVEKNGFVLIH